jgi:hypothetical protein
MYQYLILVRILFVFVHISSFVPIYVELLSISNLYALSIYPISFCKGNFVMYVSI